MTIPPVHTRSTDPDGDDAALRIDQARRQGRRRTLFYSAIVAGVVSQFFAYTNDKDQIQRSRDNCQSIQDDRHDRADRVHELAVRLRDSSDQVLGSEERHIKPFKFKGTAFEDFEALSIAQATKDRAESKTNFNSEQAIRDRFEDCKKVFPGPSIIPDINPFS